MARVWLIGESNPYQGGEDHDFDLYPLPERSAGGRLCTKILGLKRTTYLRTFERRNLLNGVPRWSAPAARASAARLLPQVTDGSALVLLGARVCAAFGVPFELFLRVPRLAHGAGLRNVQALVLPHPSGLSRAWNDPTAIPRTRESVARLLAAIAQTSGAAP